MTEPLTDIERALARLEEQRRHIDADIEDLRRIVARHKGETNGSHPRRFSSSRGMRPGGAQKEILELMADGDIWTPAKVGRARGTSPNAASVTLRRMTLDGLIEAVPGEQGQYKLASLGGAQSSLSESAEREDRSAEGGGR